MVGLKTGHSPTTFTSFGLPFITFYINQSKPVTPRCRSLGYPDRCLRCDGRPFTYCIKNWLTSVEVMTEYILVCFSTCNVAFSSTYLQFCRNDILQHYKGIGQESPPIGGQCKTRRHSSQNNRRI